MRIKPLQATRGKAPRAPERQIVSASAVWEHTTMPRRRRGENRLYPIVEKHLRCRFDCFATGVNRGTQYGRVDVVGVRDIGGDLSGGWEVIGVEVKGGSQPFGTAAGQAHGYSVYANKCYLADLRSGTRPFRSDEIDIASALGIGLLAISGGKVKEVLAAPHREPIERLSLQLLEKLDYSLCTVCRSLFRRSENGNWSANISRAGFVKAAEREKGFIYWLSEMAERRRASRRDRALIYERRYVCADCVRALDPGARR